jgi:hypothetical protein
LGAAHGKVFNQIFPTNFDTSSNGLVNPFESARCGNSAATAGVEQDGVNGKRQVGLNGGTVEEADDAQYKEMWEGRWHPPRPAASPSDALNSTQKKS